jgi:predicted transcriptional regulator
MPLAKRPKRRSVKQNGSLESWQIERIEAGLADANAGHTVPVDEFFAAIAAKHVWRCTP